MFRLLPLRLKLKHGCVLSGLGFFFIAGPPMLGAGDYHPPQDRTVYDSWIRDLEDKQAAKDRANAYRPGPARSRDDSARLASDRFMREQNKAWDEYNARVGRENARIDAQNAYYAQLRELIAGVNAGNVSAMWRYGYTLLHRSDSSAREKEIGLGWINEAARRDSPDAKQWLAQQGAAMEAKAKQIAEDSDAETYRRLTAEAQSGNVSSMGTLAMLYYNQGTPVQRQESREWRKRAIANNDMPTLYYIRDQTRWDDGDAEYRAEALDVRMRLAEREEFDAKRIFELGECFLTGKYGAPIDRVQAMKYFDRTAAAGDMMSHKRMAEAFAKGVGGPVDLDAAVARYRAALDTKAATTLGGDSRSAAVLALSTILMDPGYTHKDPQELMKLWDEEIFGYGPDADALGRLASDAIRSGRAGFDDADRALLYESRALRYGSWTGITAAELAERALRLSEAVVERAKDPAHPLYIVERRQVRVQSGGSSWLRAAYSKVIAQPSDVVGLLVYAARNASESKAATYFLAAGIAATTSAEQLKSHGLPENILYELYDEAAKRFDDPTAWLECGRILLGGERVAADPQAAAVCLQNAWDKGEVKAAYYLAGLRQRHPTPGAGKGEAWTWMQRGAEKHEVRCMELWGNHLLVSGIDHEDQKQTAEGRVWLEQAAAAGMAGANADLAMVYEKGIGVAQDDAKAIALLQRALEGGSAQAKRMLADRLAEGRGVPADKPRALKLLYEAAKDDLTAANNLGVILWRGDWGEKDVETGLQWMEVTLNAGHWITGRNLAKIYHLGLGVTADEERARGYLEKAGSIGGAESAEAVAGFYEKGEIIGKDLEAAQRWRNKASSLPST